MITELAHSAIAEPVFDHLLTGEEFFDLGDIGPCEFVDGTIVAMTSTGAAHGKIEVRLARLLDEHVEKFMRPRFKSYGCFTESSV